MSENINLRFTGGVMSGKWTAIAGLALAMLGILVPLVLWMADTDSREIEVRILSKANLNPSLPTGVDGEMEFAIGGRRVVKPYYVVVQVTNAGNRSIAAADVERPLTLAMGNVEIAQAQVLTSQPAALKPELERQERQLVVKPLLLNPGDSFQIGFLTSGAEPSVTAQARIAGISDVRVVSSLSDDTVVGKSFRLVVASALMCIYGSLLLVGFGQWSDGRRRLVLRRWATIPMAFFCGLGGSVLFTSELGVLPLKDWRTFVFIIGLVVLAVVLARVPLKWVYHQPA
ncbi:hypothetical protein JY411_00680 [Stenotrophomonas maltophilia]|nr:hypothetical protein [Stenotrophomonas maltophilia]